MARTASRTDQVRSALHVLVEYVGRTLVFLLKWVIFVGGSIFLLYYVVKIAPNSFEAKELTHTYNAHTAIWLGGLWKLLLLFGVSLVILWFSYIPYARILVTPITWITDWIFLGGRTVGKARGVSPVKVPFGEVAGRVAVMAWFFWLILSWMARSFFPGMQAIFESVGNRFLIALIFGVLISQTGRTTTAWNQSVWRLLLVWALLTIGTHYLAYAFYGWDVLNLREIILI